MKMTQKTLNISQVLPANRDTKVESMLNTWDIVRCNICRKKISMLNAKVVDDGKYFVCKGH